VPGALTANLRSAVEALAEASASTALDRLDGATLLTERAELTGWKAAATISAGGSCRLLECGNGKEGKKDTKEWIAVNLARTDDWRSLDAWLDAAGPWEWPQVALAVAQKPAAWLLERAALLGMAVAAVAASEDTRPQWTVPAPSSRVGRPRVLDLSSLWAGPLAARLLCLAGAQVTKIESSGRPDGARLGDPRFYRLLNEGKAEVSLDLGSPEGRSELLRLIGQSDIVIESSRPRAMKQLGIDVEELVAARPGLSWISITGYGRSGKDGARVAFGDDAGAAAGLADLMGKLNDSVPLFCGDAIADPLTGTCAALAAQTAWARGGGLVELSLSTTTAAMLG